MFFIDRQEASRGPKGLFLGVFWFALLAAWGMMFASAEILPQWFEPYRVSGDGLRQGLVFFCLALYAVRVTATVLLFLKRKFIWLEAFIVTALMTFVVLVVAREGGANGQAPGLPEAAGLALYVAGSVLNTWSESQRQRFKSAAANRGRLYTRGLFGLARNINYFADVVLFAGLALVTGRFFLLVIPLIMALNFVFFIIPRKEAYLAEKYGAAFGDYAAKTRKLVPFVY